jgi:hypothetical protein
VANPNPNLVLSPDLSPNNPWQLGPVTLKHLSLFEDSDNVFRRSGQAPFSTPGTEELLDALNAAWATSHLETIAITFFTEAEDFFFPFNTQLNKDIDVQFIESLRWENLTDFAVTSRLLTSRLDMDAGADDADRVKAMLRAAAQATLQMPKLQTLEIWNVREGEAAVFRYERSVGRGPFGDPGPPVLSWLTSWQSSLDPAVVRPWRRTAAQQTGQQAGHRAVELVVHIGRIPGGAWGAVLPFLKLRQRIAHPVSLHQLQVEATAAQAT